MYKCQLQQYIQIQFENDKQLFKTKRLLVGDKKISNIEIN